MSHINTIIFDSYGTLFDVHSLSNKLENHFSGKGQKISQTWREKQIEYALLRQIMGNYATFFEITKAALTYAIKKHGEQTNPEQMEELVAAYLNLDVYPEVKGVLSQLGNKQLAIFSNGSHDMLDPLVKNAGITTLFDKIISTNEVKEFKPAPASYHYAMEVLNSQKENTLFVSSNGWDISGAENYGVRTAWINRKRLPVEELNLMPDSVYQDLTGILEWV
ncbi:haloacid dehalogenase type II [Aquibacillus halophilus]|uniref:Haloacid dehalogenase type II n=1 Tax=Aquibacillus halophilus TaxID=930132 RepID=A0A6A8D927_9BACI|nr:haloacid dehalogenase type II [Aquibacillus halophilus]MRH41770.1 haloacid dehalogenase type II [Aquibacillus halophilus]